MQTVFIFLSPPRGQQPSEGRGQGTDSANVFALSASVPVLQDASAVMYCCTTANPTKRSF
ncbi:envelope glycoprotein, partial [Clarias magur]